MIYVDPVYGSSAGARGTDKPFADLASALAVAKPYDHIIIRPGQYTTGSAIAVNTSHLTIEGYGAEISASSQNFAAILSVSASDCHIEGLELNGQATGNAYGNGGMIDISAPRTVVAYCYLHDSIGYGVRLVQSWDGATIQNCTISNCAAGIQEFMYGNADVSGLNVLYNVLINNRGGGVRGTNNSSGNYAIFNEKIIGNTILGNDPLGSNGGNLGIELYGDGVVGYPKIPHQNAIVSQNYVSGCQTGISMNACGYCEVSHNQVIAGAFIGIEFADQVNCSAVENTIVCPVIANNNGYGALGYSVSNDGSGIGSNVALTIKGGRIFVDSPTMGIHLINVSGVTIDGVQVETLSCTVYSQNCSQVTIKNTVTFMHNANAQLNFPIQTEVHPGCSGFYYTNNQVFFDNPSAGCAIVLFFSSSQASISGVEISDNYTNATSCSYGFISLNSVTFATPKQNGNYPASSNNNLGFVDLTGSGNATTLFPQTNTPATPTSHAVTLYVDGNGNLHALHSTGKDDVLSSEAQ